MDLSKVQFVFIDGSGQPNLHPDAMKFAESLRAKHHLEPTPRSPRSPTPRGEETEEAQSHAYPRRHRKVSGARIKTPRQVLCSGDLQDSVDSYRMSIGEST